jgi:hypothetical protein
VVLCQSLRHMASLRQSRLSEEQLLLLLIWPAQLLRWR